MKITAHIMKPAWIITVISGLVFFLLLGLRLNIFHDSSTDPAALKQLTSEKESWMNIFQNGNKIGYAHRRITPGSGGYHLLESTRMRINTMGMVQDIYFSISGELQPDFSMVSFAFDMQSSQFNFTMKGKREGDVLLISTENQEIRIPAGENLFLASSALEAACDALTAPGQSRTLWVFDPATMTRRPVTITMRGNESLDIMGHTHSVRKISIDFMGISQTTWIDNNGTILQEDGMLGMMLQQTTRQMALEDQGIKASSDLTEMAAISSNIILKQPMAISRLTFRISGIPDTLDLNGGRQSWQTPVLTISRETLPVAFDSNKTIPPRFLAATPFIQSDHPGIREQTFKVIAPGDSSLIKARKIMNWIYTSIEKRPVLSVPNALETLSNHMGDCNEHAVLFAAMLRAANIPCQIETGLVYAKGKFYYHAWNSLFLGRWITADASMGQLPADVTHIRLLRGGPDQQMDLIGILGNIGITVLESKNDPPE